MQISIRYKVAAVAAFCLVILVACVRGPVMSVWSHRTMPVEQPLKFPPRVALVLGGGGLRGLAHVGVLRALREANIPIDLLVGTSAGSIVSVIFADQPSIAHLMSVVRASKSAEVVHFSMAHLLDDPISGVHLQQFLQHHMQAVDFSQLKIKTVVVATDAHNDQPFALATGPIVPAVNASCAVPHLFRPVNLYGHTLIDGGVSAAVPVQIALRYRPRLIVAVDVSPNALKSSNLASFAKHRAQQRAYLRRANVLITPNLADASAWSTSHEQQLINAGYSAAQKKIPLIRQKLLRLSP